MTGHGTTTTEYQRGCRCRHCREAKREHTRQWRSARDPRNLPHGTLNGYQHWGCRCHECREAVRWSRINRRELRRSVGQEALPISHGTTTGYIYWECRCHECRTAACVTRTAQLKRQNEASRATASRHYSRWTDLELSVLSTRCDLTAQQIAALLGRTVATVRHRRRMLQRASAKGVAA